MKTANQTIDTFSRNFEQIQDSLFNNQEVVFEGFNRFLNDNEDIKSEFLTMNQKERKNAFLFFLRMSIGQIAVNETFKGE